MKTAKFHEVAELIVDSHNGIYSAQVLNGRVTLDIPQEDSEILAAGPDHEHYHEVWAELEGSTCDNGKYTIYSVDGDIFIVPSGVEITDLDEIFG